MIHTQHQAVVDVYVPLQFCVHCTCISLSLGPGYTYNLSLLFTYQVDSHQMTRFFKAFQLASQRSGLCGINIAVSNMIAAISAATGQDLGSVHENSWAVFEFSAENKIKLAGNEAGKKNRLNRYGFVKCFKNSTTLLSSEENMSVTISNYWMRLGMIS